MFIYRFSKLIKSKLIWCFLIFLMAFAFVFADACSSATTTNETITIADVEVDRDVLADADLYLRLVDSNVGFNTAFNPNFLRTNMAMPNFFDWAFLSMASRGDDLTDEETALINRRYWSLIAAAVAAERMGLAPATDKAATAYLEKIYADPSNPDDPQSERVFNAEAYAADLEKMGLSAGEHDHRFKRMYTNVVYPVELATHAISYATGWVSPMELDFYLSTAYDTTVARAVVVKDTRDAKTIAVKEEAIVEWYEKNKLSHFHPEKRAIEYVTVPVTNFMEAAKAKCGAEEGGIEVLALEYYERNRDEFKDDKGEQLQYEGDVVQQAINKVATEEAIVLACEALNETITQLSTLAPEAAAKLFATEVAATYGEVKTETITKTTGAPSSEMRNKVFEMGLEEGLMAFDLCEGDDCVYLIHLTGITPETQKTLEEVRTVATEACQKAIIADELKVKSDNILTAMKESIAAGKTIQEAYDAVKASMPDVTLTETIEFVHSKDTPTGDYATDIKNASITLAPKQFAKTNYKPTEAITVYVEKRYESTTSKLDKATNRQAFATDLANSNAEIFVKQWLDTNLDANPPKNGLDQNLLTISAE